MPSFRLLPHDFYHKLTHFYYRNNLYRRSYFPKYPVFDGFSLSTFIKYKRTRRPGHQFLTNDMFEQFCKVILEKQYTQIRVPFLRDFLKHKYNKLTTLLMKKAWSAYRAKKTRRYYFEKSSREPIRASKLILNNLKTYKPIYALLEYNPSKVIL